MKMTQYDDMPEERAYVNIFQKNFTEVKMFQSIRIIRSYKTILKRKLYICIKQ